MPVRGKHSRVLRPCTSKVSRLSATLRTGLSTLRVVECVDRSFVQSAHRRLVRCTWQRASLDRYAIEKFTSAGTTESLSAISGVTHLVPLRMWVRVGSGVL